MNKYCDMGDWVTKQLTYGWYIVSPQHNNLPMAGMVTMAALLLPLQLVATILTVCITL